ncbi:MAG TPA: Na-translocating system protein MpsB, partial [Accumulibacter sp.]|nr:Na-translocating system protein MpsB [Accumulibacter sp.]
MSAADHVALDPAARSTDDAARIAACLQRLAHHLPAQAPLRDFVHHNTLHAYQHLPFQKALEAAARLSGARPWLSQARCREWYREGRIDDSDIDAALQQMPELAADESLLPAGSGELRRCQVLRAALLQPPEAISLTRWRWLRDECAADQRLPDDLDAPARQSLLGAARIGGLDEAAAVTDLWAAAGDLSASCGLDVSDNVALASLVDATPSDAR